MESTPKYQIPYLTAADKADDWPPYYKGLADRLETVIEENSGGGGSGYPPFAAMDIDITAGGGTYVQLGTDYAALPLKPLGFTAGAFTFTGTQVTAVKAGVYQFTGTQRLNPMNKPGNLYFRVFLPKSSKVVSEAQGGVRADVTPETNYAALVSVCVPAVLAAGDQIELQAYGSSGVARVYGGGFTITRLGDAL